MNILFKTKFVTVTFSSLLPWISNLTLFTLLPHSDHFLAGFSVMGSFQWWETSTLEMASPWREQTWLSATYAWPLAKNHLPKSMIAVSWVVPWSSCASWLSTWLSHWQHESIWTNATTRLHFIFTLWNRR